MSPRPLFRALRYSPGSLKTDAQARKQAREFARLVGSIVNATVSEAPISFVEVAGAPAFEGYIAHCGSCKAPAAMPLKNGGFLYLYQRLGLRRSERFLTTLEYRYVYQTSEVDDSWVFRYEYQREPGPKYCWPRCHLHVNAEPAAYKGAKPFPRLHLPTGDRIRVEDVVRHLLDEHVVPSVSPEWQEVLGGAEAAFAEIQRRRAM